MITITSIVTNGATINININIIINVMLLQLCFLKPCLQGMDELPKDFTKMFDMNMFKFDVDLIPQTIQVP